MEQPATRALSLERICNTGEAPGFFEQAREREEALVAHYNLPCVSTCEAFRSMMTTARHRSIAHNSDVAN